MWHALLELKGLQGQDMYSKLFLWHVVCTFDPFFNELRRCGLYLFLSHSRKARLNSESDEI